MYVCMYVYVCIYIYMWDSDIRERVHVSTLEASFHIRIILSIKRDLTRSPRPPLYTGGRQRHTGASARVNFGGVRRR